MHLIIGGTGTLGRALVKRLVDEDVVVFSRDEHKQQAMRREFPSVDFELGDIRDAGRVDEIFRRYMPSSVFHVAALKHVDHLEANVEECWKTNVLGTRNVYRSAVDSGADHFVFSSTDKAVDPINAYGYSKALAEKFLLSSCNNRGEGVFTTIFRWGNVLGSQGSVIPVFVENILKGEPVPITSLEMTRFWLTIDQAVDFMISEYKDTDNDGSVLVHPLIRAAKLTDLIECIGQILNTTVEYKVVGLRPGEKLHEQLVSQHMNSPVNSKDWARYEPAELRDLLEPLVMGLVK